MGHTMNSARSFLFKKRRWIQGLIGLGVFAVASYFGINLWLVVGVGAVTGIVFGKVFCRWACPIGFIMEIITGLGGPDSAFQGMYQYHKIGCPIAWISGALNKVSAFKLRVDESTCLTCGLCDKACYLSTLEPARFSLFKRNKERPGDAFACSRCMACVTACPNGSLTYGLGKPRRTLPAAEPVQPE